MSRSSARRLRHAQTADGIGFGRQGMIASRAVRPIRSRTYISHFPTLA